MNLLHFCFKNICFFMLLLFPYKQYSKLHTILTIRRKRPNFIVSVNLAWYIIKNNGIQLNLYETYSKLVYITITVFFFLYLHSISGTQQYLQIESRNLVIRHSLLFKTLSFLPFHWTLETKYSISLSGNRTQNLSRLHSPVPLRHGWPQKT